MKEQIIGGGWLGTAKNGSPFVKLNFRQAPVPGLVYVMFKNTRKSKGNSPDYLIYDHKEGLKPPEKKQEEFL